MEARRSDRSLLVWSAVLSCLCSALVGVAATLNSPAAFAGGKKPAHDLLPPHQRIPIKPETLPTGPHPSEATDKNKVKPEQK